MSKNVLNKAQSFAKPAPVSFQIPPNGAISAVLIPVPYEKEAGAVGACRWAGGTPDRFRAELLDSAVNGKTGTPPRLAGKRSPF